MYSASSRASSLELESRVRSDTRQSNTDSNAKSKEDLVGASVYLGQVLADKNNNLTILLDFSEIDSKFFELDTPNWKR
jgi:hypothetical protein